MPPRLKSARRIAAVEAQLHALEERKYAELCAILRAKEAELTDLRAALDRDHALRDPFLDIAVRRLGRLAEDIRRATAARDAQAAVMLDHAGRLRNARRLADELAAEARRDAERRALEEVVDAALAARPASLGQDR